MSGYVDLHCHYLPGIDDGVRSLKDGIELCQGLVSIGYQRVVATPHIRTAMFDNDKRGLMGHAQAFKEATVNVERMPELGLGAEHFFDDVFWRLFTGGEAVPYPGGRAMLVEFPTEMFPINVAELFSHMGKQGVCPVLAHPERYRPCFDKSQALQALVDVGAMPLLDVMSLVGHYGQQPLRAAERILDEDLYYAACSDSHRPRDVAIVQKAIARLESLVGEDRAQALLGDNPAALLD